MFAICQDYYAFGVEVKFTRIWDFTWWVSDLWRISGGYSQSKIV